MSQNGPALFFSLLFVCGGRPPVGHTNPRRGAILAKSPWTLWPAQRRRAPLSTRGPIRTSPVCEPPAALGLSGQYLAIITIWRLFPLANNSLTPPLAWSQSCSNPNPLPSSTSCFFFDHAAVSAALVGSGPVPGNQHPGQPSSTLSSSPLSSLFITNQRLLPVRTAVYFSP
ncbi:hypothetical protein M441DRAFT_455099 [Trichoderma asperellum CBS 433.97]|uniref:Uncharacterized protein n=1 Tax=Trichoderma asperellum (strain ATCC 204424 / CBS 433.97 / NBRC 101777) TaxID=1042311 RepID=A0A2T3ZEE7_TRIA4|nr:hypothetical protein M441DRAFT_455099 [Trichoderma asperellum CBS 433.97]PTB43191.1 hypothetical protein M441DRAFT_455099 [Trichoderma asperellum CBS 433.97]